MPLEFQSSAITTTHGYQVTCDLLIVVFDPCTRMMNNRGKVNLHTQAKRVSHRTRRQHIHKRVRYFGVFYLVNNILRRITCNSEILDGCIRLAIPKLATRDGKHPGDALLDIAYPVSTVHE